MSLGLLRVRTGIPRQGARESSNFRFPLQTCVAADHHSVSQLGIAFRRATTKTLSMMSSGIGGTSVPFPSRKQHDASIVVHGHRLAPAGDLKKNVVMNVGLLKTCADYCCQVTGICGRDQSCSLRKCIHRTICRLSPPYRLQFLDDWHRGRERAGHASSLVKFDLNLAFSNGKADLIASRGR